MAWICSRPCRTTAACSAVSGSSSSRARGETSGSKRSIRWSRTASRRRTPGGESSGKRGHPQAPAREAQRAPGQRGGRGHLARVGGEGGGGKRLAPVAHGTVGVGVHLDDDAVGADRGGRARERADELEIG